MLLIPLMVTLANALDPVHTFCKLSGNIVCKSKTAVVYVIKSLNANKKCWTKTINLIILN